MTLSSLPINRRITILTGMAVAGTLLVLGLGLLNLNGAMRKDIAVKTQHVVESAQSIVAHYGAEEQAGRLTRPQAQAAALTALRGLRYG
ncbi:MAG TPA: chemotaxis protein, partial [Caulobacteraceae bacterium]|nr:chemotaxis protein [Caulobacteraceae bacterium]